MPQGGLPQRATRVLPGVIYAGTAGAFIHVARRQPSESQCQGGTKELLLSYNVSHVDERSWKLSEFTSQDVVGPSEAGSPEPGR